MGKAVIFCMILLINLGYSYSEVHLIIIYFYWYLNLAGLVPIKLKDLTGAQIEYFKKMEPSQFLQNRLFA